MHEDIDDYEPDMEQYYRIDPEERALRKEKYRWSMRYADGKISYKQYIAGLSNFTTILDADEWREIRQYENDLSTKRKLEDEKKAAEQYMREKKRVETNETITHVFLIFTIIFFILMWLLWILE